MVRKQNRGDTSRGRSRGCWDPGSASPARTLAGQRLFQMPRAAQAYCPWRAVWAPESPIFIIFKGGDNEGFIPQWYPYESLLLHSVKCWAVSQSLVPVGFLGSLVFTKLLVGSPGLRVRQTWSSKPPLQYTMGFWEEKGREGRGREGKKRRGQTWLQIF